MASLNTTIVTAGPQAQSGQLYITGDQELPRPRITEAVSSMTQNLVDTRYCAIVRVQVCALVADVHRGR